MVCPSSRVISRSLTLRFVAVPCTNRVLSALISSIGIAGFVDTLGAILAPLYGILIADYYVVQKRQLRVDQMFTEDPAGAYYYDRGWNRRAILAVGLAALFSVGTVWLPALQALSGFGWLIGAVLGGVLYILLCGRR